MIPGGQIQGLVEDFGCRANNYDEANPDQGEEAVHQSLRPIYRHTWPSHG